MILWDLIDNIQDIITLIAVPTATILLILIYRKLTKLEKSLEERT